MRSIHLCHRPEIMRSRVNPRLAASASPHEHRGHVAQHNARQNKENALKQLTEPSIAARDLASKRVAVLAQEGCK